MTCPGLFTRHTLTHTVKKWSLSLLLHPTALVISMAHISLALLHSRWVGLFKPPSSRTQWVLKLCNNWSRHFSFALFQSGKLKAVECSYSIVLYFSPPLPKWFTTIIFLILLLQIKSFSISEFLSFFFFLLKVL